GAGFAAVEAAAGGAASLGAADGAALAAVLDDGDALDCEQAAIRSAELTNSPARILLRDMDVSLNLWDTARSWLSHFSNRLAPPSPLTHDCPRCLPRKRSGHPAVDGNHGTRGPGRRFRQQEQDSGRDVPGRHLPVKQVSGGVELLELLGLDPVLRSSLLAETTSPESRVVEHGVRVDGVRTHANRTTLQRRDP